MNLAPVLDREEYVEQAYLFRILRERLKENLAAQEILTRIHEEIISTTRLPYAIQFLATELKHSGLLWPGFERLPHYFTPFQTFVVHKAEEEGMRFSMDSALRILEAEASYRSRDATPAGLFIFQFEVLSRNRLGYDDGLTAIAGDGFYDQAWRDYLETIRRNVGEVDFADLIYLRSERYKIEQLRLNPEQNIPPVLFAEKEGKIAKASRGRDPLYLFAALQRQLGYPFVPRPAAPDSAEAKVIAVLTKLRELEARVKLVEGELRGKADVIQHLGKPELLQGEEEGSA